MTNAATLNRRARKARALALFGHSAKGFKVSRPGFTIKQAVLELVRRQGPKTPSYASLLGEHLRRTQAAGSLRYYGADFSAP